MKPIVFITGTLDAEDTERPYPVAQVRVLADTGAPVLVVSDDVRGDPEDLHAPVVASGAGLEAVLGHLADAIPAAVAIVDGTHETLASAAAALSSTEWVVLWWCPDLPAMSAVHEAEAHAHGMLTVGPVTEASGLPSWAIGAGVDDAALPVEPRLEQPPLRLITLARGHRETELSVVVRALAVARGHGVDARLTVLGLPPDADGHPQRKELRDLAADLVLGHALDFCDAVPGSKVPSLLAAYHVVVDLGVRTDPARFALEAMAAERVVVSSSEALTPLLAVSPIPLGFDPGGVGSLASVIVAVGQALPAQLGEIGAALRIEVTARHSATAWANRIVALVERVDDWRDYNARVWIRSRAGRNRTSTTSGGTHEEGVAGALP